MVLIAMCEGINKQWYRVDVVSSGYLELLVRTALDTYVSGLVRTTVGTGTVQCGCHYVRCLLD